jgi:hypothetical protein
MNNKKDPSMAMIIAGLAGYAAVGVGIMYMGYIIIVVAFSL